MTIARFRSAAWASSLTLALAGAAPLWAQEIADTIYRTARALFDQSAHQAPFRLIGTGLSDLCSASEANFSGDLLDPQAARRAQAERAADTLRGRFGASAIVKGRALR